MYNNCCVVNCNSRRKDTSLHNFPSYAMGFQKWVQCLSDHVNDDLRRLSVVQIRKMFVCHKHFEKKFITSKRRLRSSACPTLFTDREIANGISETASDASTTVDPQIDHQYTRKRHLDHTYAKPGPLKELTNTQNGTSDAELNAASSNNRHKKTWLLKKCCLCERVENEDSSEDFITRFPVDPEVCKQWVRNVGIAHLARKTLTYLHNNVYLCQVHFKTPQENSSTFEAVPTEALPYPPLPDDMLADFPVHSEVLLGLESEDHVLDYNIDCDIQNTDGDHNMDCGDQNVTCDLDAVKSEAESEDEYNCDIGYTEETVEAVNIPSAVDEIDSLFLSYAGTFRKLSPNLQTMLKLDIAKLFARYEMKNTVTENKQQKETNEISSTATPAPFKMKAKTAECSSKISKSELKSNRTLKRQVASEELVTLSVKRSKHLFTPRTYEFNKVNVCTNPEMLEHQIGTNHPDIERTKTLTIDQIETTTDQNNFSESLFVLKDFGEECEQFKEGDPLLEKNNLNMNATQITDLKMDKL